MHKFIENEVVITDFFNDSLAKVNNLKIGDIIIKVDGKKISTILDEKSKYIQGGNPTAKQAYAWNKIFNGSTDSVELEFRRDNKLINKRVGRYQFKEFNFKRPQKESWRKINKDIGYVNLGNLILEDIPVMIDSLINTKGIIFDIRNYPKDFIFGSMGFLFSSKETIFFKSIVPDLTYPGKFIWKKGDKYRNKKGPKFKGKVVILVNERTISLAEFTAMYLQSATNSITIGSTTLAADGNVSKIEFPGGFITRITGIGIFYPNGKETQRIGIKIDIKTKPSIKGISEGKDEVLEKAIEIIQN
jgi:C-terminal processing protease CtpA/Prc